MKNVIFILSFMAYFLLSSVAFSQQSVVPGLTTAQRLNQLFSEYNKRFANGQYISNKDQVQSFNLKQDALAAELKKSGNLKQILFITNDYEQELTVKLYALIDEKNNLLGIFYEKSYYYDEEGRSYLRFSTLVTLADGLKFVPVNGSHALVVTGHYFKPTAGGTLQFAYLKDLRGETWGTLNLFLINRGQGWGLFDLQYQLITTANVKTWTNIFPPNGGVTDISVR